MISAAFICITPLPMYSGKPVSKRREDAALSWVLFHSQNHITVLQKLQAVKTAYILCIFLQKPVNNLIGAAILKLTYAPCIDSKYMMGVLIVMEKAKKNKIYLFLGASLVFAAYMLSLHNNEYNNVQYTGCEVMNKNIAQEVLRLHILANSDADYDQRLKLEVKSAVASAIADDMKNSGIDTKEKAVNYMKTNSEKYISIAKDVIASEGYSYDVTATIGRHWFPVKIYGNALYPEGEYDAYRMLIGSAEGKNWWCVLFPSLCMVDEACHVEDENVMNTKDSDSANSVNGDDNVQFQLGIVEWFKNMW